MTITLNSPTPLAGHLVEVRGADALPIFALDRDGNDATKRVACFYLRLFSVRNSIKAKADEERHRLYLAQFAGSTTEQNTKGQRS